MFKKWLSAVIAAVILITSLLISPISASARQAEAADSGRSADISSSGALSIPSEKGFQTKLAALRIKYPHNGRYSGTYYEDGYAKAWTCHGYACQLLYEIFGIKYYTDGYFNKLTYTMGTIYAGDLVRIDGDSHSIIIIKVTGSKVYYTDANVDNNNKIAWDSSMTLEKLRSRFVYKMHIPGNTLTGNTTTYELKTPQLLKAENSASGITVEWGKVTSAVKYRLYYYGGSVTKWTKVIDTDALSYRFTKAVYKTKYTFTVRAINSKGQIASDYEDPGISSVYGFSPTLSISSAVGKITVSWDKVSPSGLYRVFIKNGTGYKRLADTKALSYDYTAGTGGVSYTFTVRCIDKNGAFISDYIVGGISARFLTYSTQFDTPKNIKAAAVTDLGCIKITWDKSDGAQLYQVFYNRPDVDSGWHKLAQTAENSYIHSGCVNDKTYRYTIRCIDQNGKFTSGYDNTGATVHYYHFPTEIKATASHTQSAVSVTWNAIAGVKYYQVFYNRPDVDSGWHKLYKTTSTSYLHKNCDSNKVYRYTVRCVDSKGAFISGYSTEGTSLHYFRYPDNIRATQWGDRIIVTYDKVDGAASYAVFYKDGDSTI